jgi:hypothetical protein
MLVATGQALQAAQAQKVLMYQFLLVVAHYSRQWVAAVAVQERAVQRQLTAWLGRQLPHHRTETQIVVVAVVAVQIH